MGLLDKFLDAIKLNDDFDDEDDFYDEDDFDDEDDFEDEKPKRRFFKKLDDDFDDYDDDYEEPKKASKKADSSYKQSAAAAPAKNTKQKANSKITPMRNNKKAGAPAMEVIVIRPTTMEDTREIADTLMDRCTVVLNLEGLDVYLAQKIGRAHV